MLLISLLIIAHRCTKSVRPWHSVWKIYIKKIYFKKAGKSADLVRSFGPTDYLPSCSTNSPKSGEGLFDFKPVSCSEVREILTAVPSKKAPGYNSIPPFVIKDCLPYILPTLTRLINSSFACSEFPRVWKKSVIRRWSWCPPKQPADLVASRPF